MSARDGAITVKDRHGNLWLTPAQTRRMRRDFAVLISLDILVNLFVAYEIAGLTLPGWHTISYYAHVNRAVDYAIVGALLVAGPIASIWFWKHSHGPIAR